MADISITAANVLAVSGAQTTQGFALAAVTAGQVVYRDATTQKFGLADNDGADQPLSVLTYGSITIGGTLTAGTAYYLSDNPGGICPVGDLETGDTATLIGIATSTSVLKVDINPSGVTL